MTRPVPVLFLFPALRIGGAERQMEALVRRLDGQRFLPVVACQHGRGPVAEALRARDIAVHQLSNTSRFDPLFLPRTWALLRRQRVRILCTQGFSTGVVGRLAACLAGVPVRIVLEHSTGERDMSPAKHRLNRWLHRLTSAWIAVAQGQVPYLTQVKGVPPDRIHVVHNGIDVTAYDLGEGRAAARQRVREEFGFDAAAPVAGSLAVLRPEKDLRSFVRAAAQVLRQLPTARFVIVGDGPERAALIQEITLLGLERHVVLAGWRDDLPAVLAALDVAVLCSTEVETFPVAFLEAMAAGLPLVGTRVGGLPEMITPGENGLLVSPGSVDELSRALVQVLEDPQRARRWGEVSRHRVAQEFGIQRMVRRYEALFEALLATTAGIPNARAR